MTFTPKLLALSLLCGGMTLIACGDDPPAPAPPPPPSTAPVISALNISCVQAPADTLYPYDYKVLEGVSVRVVDAEEDLLADQIFGSINGYAMDKLEDADGDGVFEWKVPAAYGALVCRNDVFVHLEAVDLDDNIALLDERVTK